MNIGLPIMCPFFCTIEDKTPFYITGYGALGNEAGHHSHWYYFMALIVLKKA